MLYDASRAGNAAPAWFEPAYWQERGEIEGEARGRGATQFIRSGKQNLVLRHFRRGGLVARVMRDRYLWRGESATRAFAEWHLLYHLHRAGLPVPAPVACRYRRRGLIYTADIITERLMDSVSLAEQLRNRGIPILGWITIGRCIRAFHDLGVCHADLNAHNIMLVGDDSVYLIDFDRGRLRRPGLWCDGNLVRLRRSLEKITYKMPPEHFSEADWHGLLDGYRQSGGVPGATRPPTPSSSDSGANRTLNVASDLVASAPPPAAMPAMAAPVPSVPPPSPLTSSTLPLAAPPASAGMTSSAKTSALPPAKQSAPSPGAASASSAPASHSPVPMPSNEVPVSAWTTQSALAATASSAPPAAAPSAPATLPVSQSSSESAAASPASATTPRPVPTP
jgi:3-deoxy-D-manno-octulosonic acid kinase